MSDRMVDVVVPTLGESISEATVGQWLRNAGDQVAQDEILCELETDKVMVEVPASRSGVLAEIVAPEGTTIAVGARLAVIDTAAGADKTPASKTAAADGDRQKATEASSPADSPPSPSNMPAHADVEDAPSARKAMAEAGLARDRIAASGRDGRVLKEDVLRAAAQPVAPVVTPAGATPPATAGQAATLDAPSGAAPAAALATSPGPREERVRISRLRSTIAHRLKDAQNTAAILTTYNEADMSAVMALRTRHRDAFARKHGVKLGMMSFFVKACCHALQEVPEVNAEIEGNDIVYKHYVHMGVAVSAPQGLVVPVIHDADRKGFATIEREIAALGTRARNGELTLAEMQGGTFTISNGGVYGSLMSAPILNPPQSGILGMHKIQDRPVAVDGQIVIRPMMYLALSYDHRLVDGQAAVTFLVRVKDVLEDPGRLLLDL